LPKALLLQHLQSFFNLKCKGLDLNLNMNRFMNKYPFICVVLLNIKAPT